VGDGLVERDFEMQAVRSSLAGLARGAGSVLAIAAPAGLGKTALLRLAREQARDRGFLVLSARGAQLEANFAFGVVRQLVEPALPGAGTERELFRTGAAEVADGLFANADDAAEPGPPDGGRPPDPTPMLLYRLYRLVNDLAETKPVVVIVDDMQWVDPSSARFLGFLARRVDTTAITLIVSARSSRHQHDESLDEILAAAETLLLRPRCLTRSAVAELMRCEFGRDCDEEFSAACHAITGGNPLFLRELLRTLAAAGIAPDSGSVAAARAAGPDAVRRHVLVALRRRSAVTRSVAHAIAVLGDDTDLALVAWQCDQTLAATAAAAEQLAHDGLLERADPPTFVHTAVRDAVLALTLRADRTAQRELTAPKPSAHEDRNSDTDGDTPGNAHENTQRSANPASPTSPTSPTSPASLANPTRPKPTGVDTFTSAEREVAALAVSGLTNREIAVRLFLSEKTIECHLSRAYRKVGVRSRTQLAAHLATTNHPARPGESSASCGTYQSPPTHG
jgi:DNA-binding NarL/FixJ family response regulator